MQATEPQSRVASNEYVRDINRRVVLNLIRTRQPISRADLARMCGLQRSTISLIVEQLIEERWVIEGPTGRLPRGRRPTFLRLNNDRAIIGVDIRPSQITVALSDVSGKFTSQETMATPQDPDVAIKELIEAIRRASGGAREKKIEGVGISLPGRFNETTGRLVFAPNLKWPELDIRGAIEAATGLEVEQENAANACVLAAVWFDHIKDEDLVVVTVSEGIGAGVLANGKLMRGLNGMAGELGHVPLDVNGPVCGCGSRGCWEVYGSNRAALRYYAESAAAPDGLSFPELLTRAESGDVRALNAIEKMARYVGLGMRMIVVGLAPQRIIVLGDLTRSWHLFSPVIEAELRSHILPGGSLPILQTANEDGMARLRGAVALMMQKHFAAP